MDPYRNARKLYVLISAVLWGWTLFGATIGAQPSRDLDLTIGSPDAVPYVLVALVLYFAVRFSLEWFQIPPENRSERFLLIDFRVCHCIGAASISAMLAKSLTQVPLAGEVTRDEVQLFMAVFSSVVFLTVAHCEDRAARRFCLGFPVATSILVGYLLLISTPAYRIRVATICALGLSVGAVLVLFILSSVTHERSPLRTNVE
jgi:hypothetical protein